VVSIRVEVTTEDIERADADESGWKDPVEFAIARVAGVDVSVDRDVPDGYMAAIGNKGRGSTVVVNLPPAANAYLDEWWDRGDLIPDPISFDIELDTWLTDLVRIGLEAKP
jgi:hypothetical protein